MSRIVTVGRRAAVQAHADRYKQFDKATVCGAVGSADESFDDLDAPVYDSIAHALRDDDVDGVDICGPGAAYDDTLNTALDAGIPIRCDPPFALDEAQFDRRVSGASNENGWLMAHSPHRFSRLYSRLRSDVETGAIGTIGVARIKRTVPFSGPGWNTSYDGITAATGHVEALCSVLAHDIDILDWTFGAVGRVFARARSSERYDHAHAVLTFQDGGRATIETTWSKKCTPSPCVNVEYSGNHGRLNFNERDASTALQEKSVPLNGDPPEDDCRGRLLQEFVTHIHDNEKPSSNITPINPSRVTIAVRRSVDEGLPITIAEESL
ncbi:Predicted dehydrogenase [Haladaptatus litoreus]|uniref:Predicted dehydrogenase n=1 Tax=Haladaptatus litoreus TaxID=553468 RepID=A0A1N7DJ57_9EURY|nr:Gfo/Idh/MocA family oxidoreductase [Haladaptatus litoreus]SIR75817.1 Predicted dehydrogenase [Haladaptatus litoreus]